METGDISQTSGNVSSNDSKNNRLSYPKIKELREEIQALRIELHKSQSKETLERLDAFIVEIQKLTKSSSKYLDVNELHSDLEWIIEYYKKKEWPSVTRWLSNIDSTMYEMWSAYMNKLKAEKNKNQ
jgi:hypothetical protein